MSSQVTVFSRVKKSAAAEFAILYPRLVPVASVELPIGTWCTFRSRRNQRTRLPNPALRGFRLIVSETYLTINTLSNSVAGEKSGSDRSAASHCSMASESSPN
jgi:hypothetical protein